jgi:hypothetical protein
MAVRAPTSGSKSRSSSSFRASLPHFDTEERYEPVHVGSCIWGFSDALEFLSESFYHGLNC